MEKENIIESLKKLKLTDEEKRKLNSDINLKINELIKDNVSLASRINNFKSKNTQEVVENSLGALYNFTLDQSLCAFCDGKVDKCPKVRKGLELQLVYDEALKKYTAESFFCKHYVRIKDSYRNNLLFSSLYPETIMDNRQKFLLKLKESISEYKDYISLQKILLEYMKSFDNSKNNKGVIISCKENSSSIVYLFSAFIHKLISETDYKVSYIDFKTDSCSSFISDCINDDSDANKELKKIFSSQVLIINNFDIVPQYAKDFDSSFWLPLLEERCKNGYITFANLSNDLSIKILIYKKNRYLDKKDKITSCLNTLFDLYSFNGPSITYDKKIEKY